MKDVTTFVAFTVHYNVPKTQLFDSVLIYINQVVNQSKIMILEPYMRANIS